uniref:F-box only protein 41 n=1 Tax=Magallana gigas TaxID=29159 RepID=K1QZ43_MAGGI
MGLERLLQVCESTLLSLSIIDCGTLLTDKSIWLASCYSRMLRSVEYLSSSFPLGPDVMYALGAGCRDITTLKIHPIYPCENEEKFSNKCLQIVSQFCSDLEVLSIGGSKVDINGLVLIESCKHLKDVQVSLFISDFYQGKAEKEDTKLKKWQKFVKDIKSLERIPGLGNILKLSLQNT